MTRHRPRRSLRALGALCVLLVLATACGDDGDEDAGGTTSSTTRSDDSDGGATTGTDGGNGDGTGTDGGNADDGTGTDGGNADDGAGEDGGSADGTTGPAPDLTSAEICERVPAATVASALAVPSVDATPGTAETPQCSYGFELDGGTREVTVSALRTEGDLDGREGAEAFRYVIDLNTRAAGGDVEQTPVEVGDQATVLTGQSLRMGVVQYGPRIVTTLVTLEAADAGGAAALTEATTALAP